MLQRISSFSSSLSTILQWVFWVIRALLVAAGFVCVLFFLHTIGPVWIAQAMTYVGRSTVISFDFTYWLIVIGCSAVQLGLIFSYIEAANHVFLLYKLPQRQSNQ